MEVADTLERPEVFAALIKGGPWDLAWYEPGKERGTYVILRVRGLRYYLYSGEQAEKVWAQLQESAPGIIPHEITEGEIILDFPMVQGKVFGGEFANLLRGRYCWLVEAEQELSPKQFPGAEKFPKAKTYVLGFYTSPDRQTFSFTMGVGITAYRYHHRGSTSSTDLELVEFVKGAPK